MSPAVGFTGTQRGMTRTQLEAFRRELERLLPASGFHHGDCVGADEQAHGVALELGIPVVVHPPDVARKRAFCGGGEVLPERPYLVRNRDIVDSCDVLLATPAGPEVTRSGTWSTVRYARGSGKEAIIIFPGGERSRRT